MAKKIISDIEKGVGFIAGFIPALMNAMRTLEVPFEAAHRLVTEDGAATVVKIAQVIKDDWFASQPKPTPTAVVEPEPTLTPFTHTFDYGKTVEQLLTEGEYDGYVDRANVTQKNFPVTEKGVVTKSGHYAHFGKNMSDAAVDAWCEKNNKRRGTAHETLTIGAADKPLQRKHPVVSGQPARIGDGRRVAYLCESDGQRGVGLGWIGGDDDWDSSCRFVVFDK
ncbi:MAG: hypothetical protein AAB663_03315 [Patescibacteria group bacterium]